MHGFKVVYRSEPVEVIKGYTLEDILTDSEIGVKKLRYNNLRMARTKSDKIKETDVWANNLCTKYCLVNKDGKEAKSLFK